MNTATLYKEVTNNPIYEQYEAAFKHVSAYVITDSKGERVATIAFKFPRDGAGRMYCYLHVFGFAMVRAYASGYGYDKRSAATHAATKKVLWSGGVTTEEQARYDQIKLLLAAIKDEGSSWDGDLRNAGFNVLQAV